MQLSNAAQQCSKTHLPSRSRRPPCPARHLPLLYGRRRRCLIRCLLVLLLPVGLLLLQLGRCRLLLPLPLHVPLLLLVLLALLALLLLALLALLLLALLVPRPLLVPLLLLLGNGPERC